MATGALHNDLEAITRCHDCPASDPHHADGQHRRDVQGERSRQGRITAVRIFRQVEKAFVKHVFRAVVALFAWLEHEQHAARDFALSFGQQAGGLNQHAGVGVVPTGMHDVVVLRREVEAGVFRHRKSVHVATQQHRGAGLVAGQESSDAARRLVQCDVERQVIECSEHLLACRRQIVADFGMLMQ